MVKFGSLPALRVVLDAVWAEAALERGDKVAATARNVERLAGLKKSITKVY